MTEPPDAAQISKAATDSIESAECDEPDSTSVPQSIITYSASIYQNPAAFPVELGEALDSLSELLNGVGIFLLIQGGAEGTPFPYDSMSEIIANEMLAQRDRLPEGTPIAVVIDSLGGDARGAYRIATILQKHCSGYLAAVPRRAKSAATFLTFGADCILLSDFGELGPLDVQIREELADPAESALNEVESVQRLFTDILQALDQTMVFLMPRLGRRRAEQVLPYAVELVTGSMRPLVESVDTRLYTKRSRDLKVGEDYATRLLSNRYEWVAAESIAQIFVRNYSDHGFIIDTAETARIVEQAAEMVAGRVRRPLPALTEPLPPGISATLNRLHLLMGGVTAIGMFEREVTDGANPPSTG